MVPAWKILTADFDPADVRGKIIFVGASAAALNDLRASPVHPSTAGVEFHAQVVEQIISGKFLKRSGWAKNAETLY